MDHYGSQESEFGENGDQDELIFRSINGNPIDPRAVWGKFKIILKVAGIKDIRFHDLRHTAASLMLSSGMATIKVAQQLGHSKPSTTLDIYGHLIPGMDKDGGARIDQLVNPIATELQQVINFSVKEDAKIARNV